MIKRILFSCTRVLLLLSAALLLFQCQMIYAPRRYDDVAALRRQLRPVEFTTSQGKQVAWLRGGDRIDRTDRIDGRDGGDGLVWLVFGGNGSLACDYRSIFDSPGRSGDAVLFVDFPGYGACEGRPTPDHIRESIIAVLPALAKTMQVNVESLRPRLRVFGHSMGAAAALMAMSEHSIQRGLLIAPFARMMDMAELRVGWPLCCLLHHRFDNVAELERIAAKPGAHIEVIHGTADEVIPSTQSDLLIAAQPKLIHVIKPEGARHNDILATHRALIEQQLSVAAMASRD